MSKFTPSQAEVALVNQIFTQADTQKLGVITGDAAVKIFSGSKLPPAVLAEIWNLADEDNNGVLTRKGVAIAVRLLGHAQRGETVSEASINKPGPIPTIEGLTPALVPQSTGVPAARSPPPGFPALTAQDKAKFLRLFQQCGPISGLLGGDKARDVFVKSKLPVDKLSQTWNLADTKNRGALDATDFVIAMYLIQACMSGQLQNLPATLPPGLYEQAAAKTPVDGVAVHATGGSGKYSPSLNSSFSARPTSTLEPHFTGQSSPIQPQMTGQTRTAPNGPPLPARSALANPTNSAFPFLQQQATGAGQQQWDVTLAEKASADRLFDTLDTQKKGYIEGDVAVPFMLQSKLPEDVLARVWDLADLNNDGRLTRDGFAVAMHLIQNKLNGKELPTTIPLSLIPPSMRTPTAPLPSQPSIQDSIRDLIWDETPPTSATLSQPQHPVLQPQSTGTLTSRTPIASPPQRAQTMVDPFGSSSPFAAPAPTVHHDLLGDDDEPAAASSPPLQDQSAEIGNVKNQLNSTNRSLEVAKAEREDMERKLAEQAAQLSALQTQLSSAKAAYETETRLLSTLRERYSLQTAEIQKAREELIHGESDLSAIRVEKAEVGGALLRDKDEVRELQRRMTEVHMEVETLKTEVEKAKKEAKQQKGLLAIAKKQLATREAERAKIQKELEEAKNELQEATKEVEEVEAEAAKEASAPLTNGHNILGSPDSFAMAVAQPLPATPDIPPTSPTGSVLSLGKSNNPFERVAMASGTGSRSQSPFLPFANAAVLPTPPTAPANAISEAEAPTPVAGANPFRFSQAFATEESQDVLAPSSGSALLPAVASPIDLLSPTDTDLFHTPPSSATFQAPSPAVQDNPQTTESSAAETPVQTATPTTEPVAEAALDAQDPAHPPGLTAFAEDGQTAEQHDTDLAHQLKELEVEESDSDTDSDEDEPLAAATAPTATEVSDVQAPAPMPNGFTESSTVSAFDDSFGISSMTEEPQPASSFPVIASTPVRNQSLWANTQPASEDAFGAAFAPSSAPQEPLVPSAPPALPETVPQANGSKPHTPGVDDFDEAMGKISASPSTSGNAPQFTQFGFDSAFDDDFDFAAASAATDTVSTANGTNQPEAAHAPTHPQTNAFDSVFMTQPSTSASQATVTAPTQPQATSPPPFAQPASAETRPFSFDDAFGPAVTNGQPNLSQSGTNGTPHGIAFDDAFGGRSSALALDSSFTSTSSNGAAQPRTSAPPPSTSPPLSPIRTSSPQFDARRSISPARRMSPPPRHSSPKPRPSTGSSDKEKAPTHRSSKLSIRLPFGRKKKTHDVPPMPPPLASQQLVEEPTPAVDDDIPAVKQLCGMGFSRTQAVTALELHDYDMQRALNSLLGGS